MSVNNNYDQNVQQALDDVAQQYKDVEAWIAQIEADEKDMQNQSQNLVNHYWWGQSINHNATNAISADKADIAALAGQIAGSSGGNSSFATLADAIMDCVNADGSGGLTFGNQTNFVNDLNQICTTLTALVQALQQKVVIQEDEDAISLLNQNPNGANSSDVSVLIQKVIGDEGQEANTLESLTSNLDDALKQYQTQYNNASNDENDIHWYDWLNPWTIQRKDNDEANKNYATTMMSFIQTIKSDIIPEQASLLPDFQQVYSMINQILQKLTDILNKNLTPQEKSQELMKLNGEIMDLFVVIIGLLSLVQQDATKEKAKNEAVMSKATSLSAEMGISNTQAEMVKVAQDEAYAAQMKILSEIGKYTLMALGTIFAPGIGSALVGALMIVLEAAGVFDLLTNAIEKAIENCHTLTPEQSKIVADVLVGVMEMAVTMGGGAILDSLLKNVMENVLKVVASVVKETIEATAKEVSETLEKVLEGASKMVAPTLKKAAEEAAEQAAKKVFVAIMEKNGLKLLADWIKELVTGGTGAAERVVQKTMFAAAKDAAERAVQEAAKIISLGGDGAAKTADELTVKIMKAAEEAGNAAAAKAMDMSLEDIVKLTVREGLMDAVKVALKRGGFTALYAMGSTNMLVDILQEVKKSNKMSDKEYQILLAVAEVLQAILALIAQMAGSGAAAQFLNGAKGAGGFSALFMKIANALAPIATAAEGAAAFSQYQIDTNLADSTETMMKIKTALNILMQFLSKQIDSRRKQESKHDNAEFQEQMKSNYSVAAHLFDYLNTSAQVMV